MRRILTTFISGAIALAILVFAGGTASAATAVPQEGQQVPKAVSSHLTAQQKQVMREHLSSLSPAELQHAKKIAREALRAQLSNKVDSVHPNVPNPGYTFNHRWTMRLYGTAQSAGVGAAGALCAALASQTVIGAVIAGGACAAAAYFLISFGKPGPHQCLRIYLRWGSPPYGLKMVHC